MTSRHHSCADSTTSENQADYCGAFDRDGVYLKVRFECGNVHGAFIRLLYIHGWHLGPTYIHSQLSQLSRVPDKDKLTWHI